MPRRAPESAAGVLSHRRGAAKFSGIAKSGSVCRYWRKLASGGVTFHALSEGDLGLLKLGERVLPTTGRRGRARPSERWREHTARRGRSPEEPSSIRRSRSGNPGMRVLRRKLFFPESLEGCRDLSGGVPRGPPPLFIAAAFLFQSSMGSDLCVRRCHAAASGGDVSAESNC